MQAEMLELLHEQLLDYSSQLKEVEAEIIRKYKSELDYSQEFKKAIELKALKEEALIMMAYHKLPKK